jgi:TonB family protein
MPGKNWILQYCQQEKPSSEANRNSRKVVAQLQHGLLPPDPVDKFDFRRLPVPKNKARDFIILQGVIQEDGTIDKLSILRGIQPDADQAALAAFGQWRFRPAIRAGKPVGVEFLVGIPATVPEA